ncbi:PRD domain-containing protein [Tetragenococcus halophilus]|uniref:PRD domain-containing protein n=1 Tax=Tetragenococcus halophilus TaxID=51669 RepID=A0A3G5FIS1_TETHA|nr:PTS sugar transporter subunit IIA [Tetragenococcus halophilus]AYW50155.1 PRD domain-containing protein [Tetragenococcus halophilus]GBD64579.1 hypothetical protein TEHD23766T_2006 [Tetragenococcus halophilus subsp. flandriensis]
MQFVGLQNKSVSYEHRTSIEEYVDEKIIEILKKVLKKAEKMYLIDFSDKEFFNKLVIHLQSLFYRSKFKTYTRNSNIMELKINYPIIYDVSIYLSSLIQEELNIQFNEDEIAFIALHVGALLERQKKNNQKIHLLLFADDYHDIAKNLQENIQKALDDQVTISSIKTLEEIKSHSYDLLVTTKREVATQFDDSIFVKPFLTNRDINVLRNRIENKEKARKKESYHLLIDQYFSQNLFFNKLDTIEMDVSDVLDHMAEELITQKYVDGKFKDSIKKREEMSPTSFPSHIAVPHSIELDAKKSVISILTLQEPLKWKNYKVSMVAMVAINKKEAQTFNKLFEVFTEIASVDYNVDRLSGVENFEEFSMQLKLMIDELV